MRTQGEMSDIMYYREMRNILSEDRFYSLPYEIQKAIIMAGISSVDMNKNDDFEKKTTLKEYNNEEKIKEKVLTFFKKRG